MRRRPQISPVAPVASPFSTHALPQPLAEASFAPLPGPLFLAAPGDDPDNLRQGGAAEHRIVGACEVDLAIATDQRGDCGEHWRSPSINVEGDRAW